MNRARMSVYSGAVSQYRYCSHTVKQENVSEDCDKSQHSNLEPSETTEMPSPVHNSSDRMAIDDDIDYCNNINKNMPSSLPTSRDCSPETSLYVKHETFSPASRTMGVEWNESNATTAAKKNENRIFTLQSLDDELKNTTLPDGWSHFMPNKNFLIIAHWSTSGGPAKKEIHIHKDSSVQVFFNKHAVSVDGILPGITATNVLNNIKILWPLLFCDGTGLKEKRSTMCPRYVRPSVSHLKYGQVRCSMCFKMRQMITKKESALEKQSLKEKDKAMKRKAEMKNVKRTCKRLLDQIEELRLQVKKWKEACCRAQERVIAQETGTLCSKQLETVTMC